MSGYFRETNVKLIGPVIEGGHKVVWVVEQTDRVESPVEAAVKQNRRHAAGYADTCQVDLEHGRAAQGDGVGYGLLVVSAPCGAKGGHLDQQGAAGAEVDGIRR